jgi:hypothetical protein
MSQVKLTSFNPRQSDPNQAYYEPQCKEYLYPGIGLLIIAFLLIRDEKGERNVHYVGYQAIHTTKWHTDYVENPWDDSE